jgi:D-threo-aldose 1-dehydrogenase
MVLYTAVDPASSRTLESNSPKRKASLSDVTSVIGNLYRATRADEAAAALDAAWAGIRYFDTAPHYGLTCRN